jgi:hypothetical protein
MEKDLTKNRMHISLSREIGDYHVAGVLQGGTGIYLPIQHISDPFEKDVGINTHNFILRVPF